MFECNMSRPNFSNLFNYNTCFRVFHKIKKQSYVCIVLQVTPTCRKSIHVFSVKSYLSYWPHTLSTQFIHLTWYILGEFELARIKVPQFPTKLERQETKTVNIFHRKWISCFLFSTFVNKFQNQDVPHYQTQKQ